MIRIQQRTSPPAGSVSQTNASALQVALQQAIGKSISRTTTIMSSQAASTSASATSSSMTSSAQDATQDASPATPGTVTPPRKSRAERSLLSVLERERRIPVTSPPPSTAVVTMVRPHPYAYPQQQQTTTSSASATASSLAADVARARQPPHITPSPTMSRTSTRSRTGSRSSSRVGVRSRAASPASVNTGGARERGEVDLSTLVQRSIAFQSSSPPPPTPPASPPRCARRPHFSISPTTARTTQFEPCDSSTSHSSESDQPAHRNRHLTLTERLPSPCRSPTPEREPRNRHRPLSSIPSSPQQVTTTPSTASSPRLEPVAVVAAVPVSLVPIPAPASARHELAAGAAAMTLIGQMQSSPTGGLNAVAVGYPRATTLPVPLPTISATPAGVSFPINTYPQTTMRIPTVQPGILAPSPVVARPSSSTQLLSPTSSRSKGRRQRTVSPAPRPISGPLLIPTDDAMDVDMGFDLERASRQLRNQPGRVCFDEVALFPPDYDETESADADADGEDEDDAGDGSRKRPRMASRRWSLW